MTTYSPTLQPIDRDLYKLVQQGLLEKIAAGLYYKPQTSRYGDLPPNDEALVKAFLREDSFLLFSWNEYNALGLGLTQLYNVLLYIIASVTVFSS